MTPASFLQTILISGLQFMTTTLGPKPGITINWENDDQARLLLSAIAGQESNWQNISQGDGGPGRGFFQDEPETCGEVLDNTVSSAMMHRICAALDIPATESAVYASLLANPRLQVALGRLDLLCDPYALPTYGDAAGALETYIRVWGPGAITEGGSRAEAERTRWTGNYAAALAADEAYTKGLGL